MAGGTIFFLLTFLFLFLFFVFFEKYVGSPIRKEKRSVTDIESNMFPQRTPIDYN